MAGRLFPERPDVDGAEPGYRMLGRHLQGLLHVGALHDVQAPGPLPGLSERPVRDQRLATTDPPRPDLTSGRSSLPPGTRICCPSIRR
jgi:hypothetical protein